MCNFVSEISAEMIQTIEYKQTKGRLKGATLNKKEYDKNEETFISQSNSSNHGKGIPPANGSDKPKPNDPGRQRSG